MATLPNNTFSSTGKPLFLQNLPVINVSTINTGELQVQIPGTDNIFDVAGDASNITASLIAPTSSGVASQAIRFDNNFSTIQVFGQGILANNSNYFMEYSMGDPSVTKGIIAFNSTILGGTGGVSISGQDNTTLTIGNGNIYASANISTPSVALSTIIGADGTQFTVGNAKTVTHSADLSVAFATQIAPSTIAQNFYIGGDYQSGIVFGAPSSMTLNGLVNASTMNISTINGNAYVPPPQAPVQWIDPYGVSPIVSTLGVSNSNVPVQYISTIPGHLYNISLEYSSTDGGGGAANDTTTVGVTNVGVGGAYGRFFFYDTWKCDQTYTAYRSSSSLPFLASNTACLVACASQDLNNNTQIITFESIVSQDLGVPVNQF